MAILDNRINPDMLTDMVQLSFNKKNESNVPTTGVSLSAPIAKSATPNQGLAGAINSVLNTYNNSLTGNVLTNATSGKCYKPSPLKIRLPEHKSSLKRNLASNPLGEGVIGVDLCLSDTAVNDAIGKALSVVDMGVNKIVDLTTPLLPSKDFLNNNMIDAVSDGIRAISPGIKLGNCLLDDINKSLLNSLSISGLSLKAKVNISNVAIVGNDSCNLLSNAKDLATTAMGSIAAGLVLGNLSETNVDAAATFIDGLVKNGTSEDEIYGMTGTMLKYGGGEAISNKLGLVNAVIDASTTNNTALENSATALSMKHNIIKDVDLAKPKTHNKSLMFKLITDTLGKIDPRWNLNSDGYLDITDTVNTSDNNSVVVDLASAAVQAFIPDSVPTGIVTNDVSPELAMVGNNTVFNNKDDVYDSPWHF